MSSSSSSSFSSASALLPETEPPRGDALLPEEGEAAEEERRPRYAPLAAASPTASIEEVRTCLWLRECGEEAQAAAPAPALEEDADPVLR
mmetsp:Transcript_141193/g.393491  ORF Transcript_141193/g.393491 Transcript_141193/m.393491 type:complete len:90 (+) Transcript_141193:997-1266(+)